MLGTALLGPSSFALWAAIASNSAGVSAREAGAVPDLLADARYNAAQQELLAQTYRMQPDRSLGLRIVRQAAEVAADLAQAGMFASPSLVRPLRELRATEENYREAAGKAFATAGAPATAGADAGRVAFLLDRLERRLLTATQDALYQEALYADREGRIQREVLIATPLVLGIDVMLVSAVLLLIKAKVRRDRLGAAREAAAMARSEQRSRALMQNTLDVVIISGVGEAITYQSPRPGSFGAMAMTVFSAVRCATWSTRKTWRPSMIFGARSRRLRALSAAWKAGCCCTTVRGVRLS